MVFGRLTVSLWRREERRGEEKRGEEKRREERRREGGEDWRREGAKKV